VKNVSLTKPSNEEVVLTQRVREMLGQLVGSTNEGLSLRSSLRRASRSPTKTRCGIDTGRMR
jgi:hypothetical protein